LEYVAFNDRTIYQIIAKLPYTLESMAYKFSHDQNVYGKDKLSRILQLIQDQRQIAHARATDRANEAPTATTVTGNQRQEALDPEKPETAKVYDPGVWSVEL
jgi:hypothetical protein